MLFVNSGAKTATPAQAVLANRDAAPHLTASVVPSGAASLESGPEAVPATPPTPSDQSDFAFSLQIDQETNRLIMEWSDRTSGLVVIQIPAKTAVQAFTESHIPSPRGVRINRQA